MNSDSRTVFGATSSRPELQCPAAATVQQFDDREWKSNLFKNLSQCTDVIHQEEHCSSALKEAGFCFTRNTILLQLEKSLLDIALPALSDGTFYCSLFKIENNCYCRFFESGVLEGIRYVKSYMEENFDNISMGKFIWCQVSIPEDITQYHQRYAKRLDRKRSHKAISQPSADIGRRFNYLMTKNKGSVVNAHRNLLAKAQTLSPTSENLQFLGTVLHVIKKNSHKETNQLLARYHDATGAFRSASHTWENSFQQYRVNGVPQHPPEFSSLLDTPRSSHFTWHEKCMIISAIPNNHYWDEVDQAHGDMLDALVKRYKNPATETSAIQSTVNQTSNYTDVSQPEEQRSVRTRRKALTEEDILRNLTILNPDFIEENRSTENSLYQQYKTAQIESGTLQWRLHKPHIDILCMNDINMNTGTIYDFSYVHMTRTLEGNELHYNCTCKLYATLLQLATLNDNLDAEIYNVNIRCCHIRLFKEVIEPIFVNVFTPESIPQPTKSQEIVIKSLELLDKPVCILPSTLKTKKFTVRDENDTESCNFVHLSKNRLICQSGECQTIYGCSQRKVIYLEETTNICPHLDAMKKNRNLWLVNLDNIEDDDDDEDDDQFNNQPNPDDDDAELNEPVQTDRISQVYLKKAYEIHSWISSLLKTN
ncbi:unnamed protein product [Mytilus coruscus]|uniref:SWIM-type domain-containing protein n=1 Tax=Mytilus coruscus TaxID=42192 RepID=A0A6J8BLF4_MYTCO|nr:unnamed protein product [Mytilus coruscus]